MTEFDKWLKKAYPDAEDYCIQCPSISADGWKAALEWVLNHPDLIDHYQLDYVKEELEGAEK